MILIFIINALFIWGIKLLFDRQELLGFVTEFIVDKLAVHSRLLFLLKGIFFCPPCMAGFWSVPFYYCSVVNYSVDWYLWPVYSITLCGFQYLIARFLKIRDE